MELKETTPYITGILETSLSRQSTALVLTTENEKSPPIPALHLRFLLNA